MHDHAVMERVGSWLGWPEGEIEQLTTLLASGARAGELELPTPDEARETLARLDVPPHAVEEIVGAIPSAATDPEAWWLLDHLYSKLVDLEGLALPPPWPDSFSEEEPLRRYLHLYVFLAAVPNVLRIHGARGIPEEITWSTLTDLGLQVAHYQSRHGRAGFDGAFWMWQHFRGEIFRIGRLQYNFWRIEFDPEQPEIVGRRGDEVIGVHIPSLGPLEPAACDESFAAARRFFARYFPERRSRIGTCSSWLLDEQLVEYLPETSNIVRFQQRFTPVRDWSRPGDEEVIRFVFGYVPESIEDLPQRTTLERAVVEHLRAGRHWRISLGWLEL